METKQLLGNVYDILSSVDGKTRMDKFRRNFMKNSGIQSFLQVCCKSEETKRKKTVL